MLAAASCLLAQPNRSQDTMITVSLTSPMTTSVISNDMYYIESKSYIISYDALVQLCTMIAIVYTDEGNRKRRLGDLLAAKRYYQMAIRLHQFVRHAFCHLHHN
jgi:hypothetical protein